MTPLIAILTSQTYRDCPHADDSLLRERLHRHGCRADIVPWDDPAYPFERADLAVVRSCWDFDRRLPEYLGRIADIAARTCLQNPPEQIETYSSKRYLADLAERGIAIVPLVFCGTVADTLAAALGFGGSEVVLKPTVSASGRNTLRLGSRDARALTDAATQILTYKDELLVQPFINSVQTRGECSTVVIEGKALFTMRKTPAKGGFLVHEHHGGSYRQTDTGQVEQDFSARICATFSRPPLYMRIDYLLDNADMPMLLELELNEPNLYLSSSEPVLEHLAAGLAKIARNQNRNPALTSVQGG